MRFQVSLKSCNGLHCSKSDWKFVPCSRAGDRKDLSAKLCPVLVTRQTRPDVDDRSRARFGKDEVFTSVSMRRAGRRPSTDECVRRQFDLTVASLNRILIFFGMGDVTFAATLLL